MSPPATVGHDELAHLRTLPASVSLVVAAGLLGVGRDSARQAALEGRPIRGQVVAHRVPIGWRVNKVDLLVELGFTDQLRQYLAS